MDHKKQHWVPKSYLSSWQDPSSPVNQDPFIWIVSKDGSSRRRKSPKSVFTETDFYTIHHPDGSRDLALEHGLAGVESDFCKLRDTVLNSRSGLSAEQRLTLCLFVAATHARTRSQRNHWQRQWHRVLEVADDIRDSVDRMSPADRRKLPRGEGGMSGASLSIDDVRTLAKYPMQTTLASRIGQELKILFQMNLTFLTTEDDIGFVTSDRPCVWFDPEAVNRPTAYRYVGLGFRSVEVTLPISPHLVALLCWQPLEPYVKVSIEMLRE